jgi:hypothetical protein
LIKTEYTGSSILGRERDCLRIPLAHNVPDAWRALTEAVIMAQDSSQPKNQNDVVWGASEIARVAGLPDRAAAYNLLTHGHLPARRIGRKWVSTVGQIRRAIGAESE